MCPAFLPGVSGLLPRDEMTSDPARRVHCEGAAELLAAAGIRASTRAGAARLSFHLYSTAEDLDRAATALGTSTPA